jgi:hypothetical protein
MHSPFLQCAHTNDYRHVRLPQIADAHRDGRGSARSSSAFAWPPFDAMLLVAAYASFSRRRASADIPTQAGPLYPRNLKIKFEALKA